MSFSLVQKVMIPACLISLLASLGAGWAFSNYLGRESEKIAGDQLQAALTHYHFSLSSIDNLLSDRVQGSMKLLTAHAQGLGSPSAGPEVAVGAKTFPDLLLGGKGQANRFEMVDSVTAMLGGTATLFTKSGDGFFRISTNVKKADGSRAIGTQLDPKGRAIQALQQDQPFYGLVDILGNPYLTGYEPLKSGDRTVGALYVGYKISGLEQLAVSMRSARILEHGFLALLDQKGKLLFGPADRSKEEVAAIIKDGVLDQKPWIRASRTFDSWGFTLVGTYPLADVTGPLWTIRLTALSIGLITILVIAGVLFQTLRILLLRPIHTVMQGIQRKDLTFQIADLSRDEIGDLGRAYNESNALFRGIFQTLAADAERVASGSEKLSATAAEMSRTSSEMAQVCEREGLGMGLVSRAMDGLSVHITQVESGVQDSLARTDQTVGSSEESARAGEAAAQAMEAIQATTGRMSRAVAVIQEIARQTNLLSLNAAIEAAKAGSLGKGFAVVAEEVRKLADRCVQSTRDIHALIEEVDAVVAQGSAAVQSNVQALEAIRENISGLAASSGQIAAAMQAQVATRDEVRGHLLTTNQEIEQGVGASRVLTATVADVARTASELAEVAERLAHQVAHYRI